jgi:hypothetical protein
MALVSSKAEYYGNGENGALTSLTTGLEELQTAYASGEIT